MGIVRVGRRGTSRRVSEKEEDNWSGAAYKKFQEKRKKAAADKYVTTGRGTTRIKFGDIPSTKATDTKGMWVSSGRGTRKRKI